MNVEKHRVGKRSFDLLRVSDVRQVGHRRGLHAAAVCLEVVVGTHALDVAEYSLVRCQSVAHSSRKRVPLETTRAPAGSRRDWGLQARFWV